MTSINSGKLVAGGILAGVLMNGIDYLSNNFILAKDWQNVAALRNIDIALMSGTPAMVTYIVVDFLYGFLIVLTYTAIRPRFGPGPATAAIAAFLPFLASAFVMATMAGVFFTWDLYIRWAAMFLTSTLIAGLSGAWVYSEGDPPLD